MLLDSLLRGVLGLRARRSGPAGSQELRRARDGSSGQSRPRSRSLRCEPLEDRQLLSVNPNVLWADYLGGSSVDYGFSVAIDPAGNALVTGQTSAGFTGVSGNHGGVSDAFVAKFDGNGSLVWVTYLGGSGGDSGRGIAVDGAGNALVTGQTSSTDFAGPNGSLANGSLQGTNDAFVAKVNSDGTLAWATYLGGSSGDSGTGIAFDPNGNAMVTGSTTSADFAGATGNHGGNDAFVAKVWSDGTQPDGTVAWATYLGGSGSDVANGIAVDTNGNALVAGQTMSTDFAGPNGPLANGSLQGTSDAFVAKVNGDGSLAWATYLGGTSYDSARGIAVDLNGNALVTGQSNSTDFAGVPRNHSDYDAFVAKINGGDGSTAWATYLGGSGNDYGVGIAVDATGNTLVTGCTYSSDFAGTNNLLYGSTDSFVASVTSAGSPTWAIYLGGSGYEWGSGIAIRGAGNAVVAGYTYSTDFAGADNAYQGGTYDAFVLKLNPALPNVPNIAVGPIGGLTTSEAGTTATFQVRLSTQPTDPVTIGLSSSDTTEGTASPTSLTFTPSNWMTPQTVTVTGVDDNVYDGNVAYKIITTAASNDSNYGVLDPADVSVTNKDNDLAPAMTLGGTGNDRATGVAIDANGNTYVTGYFQNTVDFNPDPSATCNLTVVGSSSYNDFVASYSPSGAFLWAHQIGGGIGDCPSIVVAAGNVFVSASFTGAVDFDPSHPGLHTLTSRGGNDEFLLKLDANTGNFTSVQQIGGSSGSEASGEIGMGPDGNLYLSGGTSSGTDLTFGSSLRPSGSGGLYITKVNPSTGQFLWATRTGTNGSVAPYSIAVDSASSIYVTGWYQGTLQFGTAPKHQTAPTLTAHGTGDAFILKTDSSGNFLWADGFGAAGGTAGGYGVAVDASGSLYITGTFNSSLDSYSSANPTGTKGILTSAGGNDAFVLKVSSSGSLLAKQRMGGPCIPWSDWGAGIAVDSASGLVYVKGDFYLRGDFGSQILASHNGWWDSFVAKLNAADLSFVQTYHVTNGCSWDPAGGNPVVVAATGSVYVAGAYSYQATFPAGDYHGNAGQPQTTDAYLMKLNPAAAMISGRVFADVNSNGKPDDGVATPQTCTVFLDLNNNGKLDPGELSTTTYADQGYYEFYGLDAGQYNVVEVPAAGWTPTTPVSQAVTLGAGQSAVVDFGNSFPTQTSIYASTSAPIAIKSSTTTTMPITVADSYRILDLNVTVNLNYQPLSDLTVTLIAPNGTRVTLASGSELSGANFTGTTFDDEAAKSIGQGVAPYTGVFRPDVPLQWVEYVYTSNIQGQWVLEVSDRTTAGSGSFLNSWGLTVIHEATAGAPTNITLSSSSVAEHQPAGTVVGTLTTADPNPDATFTYALVAGDGDSGNASFTIDGNQLKTAASFDYETKSSYTIRVRTTDQGGLWYEKAFTIAVAEAGINVTPISGLTTTEAGGTATFTMQLNTKPTANVTIALSSSDTTEGTVSPASVTFTPDNWMNPQTVTITGVDDNFYDGNVAYTIVTAKAVSSDPNYSGLDPADVSVTNLDNETPIASTNWSGYAVATNVNSPKAGAVTDVKGSWTVPAVSGSSTAYSSFWIGIDGYSSSTVEQIGTDSDLSSSGKPTYYAWYEMYPKGSVTISMTINPGDVMTAEVSYSSNKFTLSITDTKTGKTYSTTQTAASAQRSSAEWIAEAPSSGSGILPLANFGTVYFTGAQATLNGRTGTINDTAWQSVPIDMINSSGAVIAQPSGLSSDGKSFSVASNGSNSPLLHGAAGSASLTDAALAAYAYQQDSQSDPSKDKKSSVLPAVDLALLELGI